MPKRKSPTIRGKVTNWSRNFGQSVLYSSVDVLKDLAPSIYDTGSNASELGKTLVQDIREIKITQNKIKQQLNTIPAFKEAQNAARNALKDIKSGKINNQERLQRLTEKDMEMDFGGDDGDFEFNMDDSDMEFTPSSETDDGFGISGDIAEGVEPSVKSLKPGIESTANAARHSAAALGTIAEGQSKQTSAMINLGNASMQVSKQIAIADIQIGQKMHKEKMEVYTAIADNTSKLVAFNDDTMSKFAMSSMDYYTKQLEISGGILEELKRIGEKVAPPKEEEEEEEKLLGWNDVFTGKGVMKFSKYGQLVKQNFNAALDNNSMLSMLKFLTEPEMLAQMAANPMEFVAKSVVENLIPVMVKTSLKELDKTIAGFFPSLIMKINQGRNKNALGELFADIFGIEVDTNREVEYGKYEKGAVPFDGITHKSINVVIPEYLSGILATLRQERQLAFDYENGVFKTKEDLRKEVADEDQYSKISGMSKPLSMLKENLDKFQWNSAKELDDLKKRVDEMAARSVDENVMITEQTISQLGDFSKKERMALQAALRHMGRTNWMQFNVGAGKGAAAYNTRIDETQANSALMANRYQVGAGNVGYDEHLRRLNDYESIGDREFRERFEAEDEWKKSQTDLLREIRDILSDGIITFPNGGIAGGTTTGAGGIPPEILQRQKEFQRKTKSLKTHWEENDEAIKEKVYTKEEMEEGINAGKIDLRTASRNFKDEKDATSSLEASLRAFDTRFNRDKKDPNNPNNRKMGGWYESLDKWVNESTFGEKIVSIKDAVQKFFEAPSKMLSGAMDKVTNTLTTIIYGDPDHPEDSILAIARKRITETFDTLNNWLKKRYKAATNFLFGEGGLTETKAYKWIKGKTEGIIDLVFGKKNGNGLTGRSGGAFSGAFNTLSDVFFDVRRELFGTAYKDSSGKDHGEYKGSVLGSFKSAVSSAFDNMNEYLFGSKKEQEVDKDGKPVSFLDKMVNYLDIGMNNFSKAIFGKSTMSGDGEVKSGAFKEFSEGFKKHLPKALAVGVVGAGIATFSNFGILGSLFLPGGPIGGAILGTTVGFLAQSEKFRSFLFGPKDLATGNRMGGLISKGVMDWVKRHKTALVGGATFGALKGVIGGLGVLNLFGPLGMAANFLLPGGPIGGALLGAAVGIGWKSQVFQEMLYGKQDEKTGKKIGGLLNTQFSLNVKKYLPNMMFGGLAFGLGGLALGQMGLMGAMLTPGGPIGAAIMGSALGIGLASEKFKSFMFGERDKDGELKKAGIFQRLSNFLNVNVVSRLSLKLKEMSLGVENWFRRSIVLKLEEVTIPLKNSFSLLGDEIKTMFKTGWKFMTDKIDKIFTEAVGLPLGKFMEERVLKPMRSFFGNLINGLGKVFGSILASPVNAMAIMTNAMLGRYDRKGITDSRNERKAAFRGAVTGLFKGSKIKNEETGEERDATFRERVNLLFDTGLGVVTQYGRKQTEEDSNRYHTAEMKEEEAKNKAEIDAKRNAWEEEYKAKRKALDDQRNALNQIADEAAKDNYSSVKGYTGEYDKKFNPTTVGIAPSPTPSGEKPKEEETKPGTPVINDGVLRNEFGDIMLGYTPKEEKTGRKFSRFTGIGRRFVGGGADQIASDAIAEAQDIIEESTSNTEAIVGSITPITSALTVAQETRERSVNILEVTKGLLSNIFELQKSMVYRETGNKAILNYEGSPGDLALSTDEQAVMKNKTAAAKDPKTGEVKKDADQIAEEQKEAKRKKNEDLIAEVQAKTAKEHEDAKGVKGKESNTVALPNGTVIPTAPQQTNKPGTPAIASAADRKYDQDKGITGDSGDLATKYLRIIAQSVDGQLDGVGSNVYKSRKLLQIIAGAEDDDITGSGNKDRVGFFGKMRRMAFDLFTNPFRFVKNIISKPFEIVADYGKKIVDTAWNLVSGVGRGLQAIGETLWEGTKQFGKMLLSVPGAVLDLAKGVGTVVKETLVAGVRVIGEGLVGMTKGAFAVIEGAAKGIGHAINGFGKGLGLIMEGIGNASKALFKGFGEALSMGIEVAGTVAKGAVNLFTGLTEGAVNLTVEAMKGITIVGKELVKGVSSLLTNTASLMFSLVTSPISFLGSKLGLSSRTKHVIIDGGTLDTVKIVEVVELVRKIDGGGVHSPLTGLAGKVTNALSGAQKEEEAGQVANEQTKDKPEGGVSSNVTAEMAKSGLVQVGGMVKRTAATMKAVKEQIAEKKMVMDNETEQTSILGQIRDQGVKREAWWKKLLGWAGALLLFLKDKIGNLGTIVGGALVKFGEDLLKRGKDFIKAALKSTADDIKAFIKSLFNWGNGGGKPGESGKPGGSEPNKPGSKPGETNKPGTNKPGSTKPGTKPGTIAEEAHPTAKPKIGKVPTPFGNTPAPALPGEKPPLQLNPSVFGEMEQTKTVNGQTWGARTNAAGAKEIFELKNGKWEFRGVGVQEAPTPKIPGKNLPAIVETPRASMAPPFESGMPPGVESSRVPSPSLAPEIPKPGTVSVGQTVVPEVGAEAGEEMVTKVPRVIKTALEMIDGLASKLLGRPVSCASELGKKIFSILKPDVIIKNAGKFAQGFAKGIAGMAGPLGAALNAIVAAWGVGSGYHDAAYMFEVDEGAVTPAMRACALIPKTILTLWFLPCVILNIALTIIGAIVGIDHYGWLAKNLFHFLADTKEQERVEQAQEDFKNAAIEAGFGIYETGANGQQVLTDVDVTAYNKQVNKTLGDKVLDGWQTFKDEIGKNYEMLGPDFGPIALLPATWPLLTAIRHASDTETAHWLADKGSEFKKWVGESYDSAVKGLGGLVDDFMNSSIVKWLTEDSEEKPGEVAVDQGIGGEDEPTIAEELITGTDDSPGMFSDFEGWISSKLVDFVTSPDYIGMDKKTIEEHGFGIATLSYFMRRDPKDISQMFSDARKNVSKLADDFYDATVGVAKENWQRAEDSVNLWVDERSKEWKEFSEPIANEAIQRWNDVKKGFYEWTDDAAKWWNENIGDPALKRWNKAKEDLNWMAEGFNKWTDDMAKWWEKTDIIGEIKKSTIEFFFGTEEKPTRLKQALVAIGDIGDTIEKGVENFGKSLVEALSDAVEMLKLEFSVKWSEWMSSGFDLFGVIKLGERELYDWEVKEKERLDELHEKLFKSREDQMMSFVGQGPGGYHKMNDYANTKYGATGTYGTSGCAPVALSNVAKNLGVNVDPRDIGNAMVRSGDRVPGGTSESAFTGSIVKSLGLHSYKANSISDLAQMKRAGMEVIVGGVGSDYTKAGHYQQLESIGRNGAIVYDENGRFKKISLSNLARQTKTAYGFTGSGEGDGGSGSGVLSAIAGELSKLGIPDMSGIMDNLANGETIPSTVFHKLTDWCNADNGPFGVFKNAAFAGFKAVAEWLFGGIPGGNLMVEMATGGTTNVFSDFFGSMKESLQTKWNELKNWLFSNNNLSKESVFDAFKTGLTNAANALKDGASSAWDKAKSKAKSFFGRGGFGSSSFHSTSFRGLGSIEGTSDLDDYGGPDYNRLLPSDSDFVREAKLTAQRKWVSRNVVPPKDFKQIGLTDMGGYAGPSYNKISPDDSAQVKRAKYKAQAKWIAMYTPFLGSGNTMAIGAQTSDDCTRYAAAALYNAYTGENTTPGEWHGWYPRLPNALNAEPEEETGFSRYQRSEFESKITSHFSEHPDWPIYLYQTGGDGKHEGHEPHRINRVSGNHAVVIGRKLSDGTYEIYDSNGGIAYPLPLEDIFDPTAKGNADMCTSERDANLMFIPGMAPSEPITNWANSGGTAPGVSGATSGTSGKPGSTSGSSGTKEKPKTLFDILGGLSTMYANFADAAFKGKVYNPKDYESSSGGSGGGSRGGGLPSIDVKGSPLVTTTKRATTEGVVVHHMGHEPNGVPEDVDWDAQYVDKMHKDNGWEGIGYHYVIRKDGTIEAGRDPDSVGAHAVHEAGMPSSLGNSNAVGVNLSGTFNGPYSPTSEQVVSAEKLIGYLSAKYSFPLDRSHVIGHRETTNTNCPGDNLYAILPDIVEGAKSYTSSSGVNISGDNAKDVWDYLTSNGYTKEAAAGILGPWENESGVNPKKVEWDTASTFPGYDEIVVDDAGRNAHVEHLFDNYASQGLPIDHEHYRGDDGTYWPGFGLAQWTGGRGQRLYEFANSIGSKWYDLGTQIQFFNQEMSSDHYSWIKDQLNSASSPEEASDIFTRRFEENTRSDYFPPRRESARQFYDMFSGSGEGDNLEGDNLKVDSGNLEGYTGPSYNFITDDDSNAVKAAKIIAQKKWLQTNIFKPDIQATKVTIFDDISKKLNFGEQLEEVKKMAEEKKENDYSDLWGKMVDILGEIAKNTKGLDKSIQGIKIPFGLNRPIILPTGAGGGSGQMSNIEMTVNNTTPTPSKQAETNAKIAAGGEFKK